MKPLNLRNTIEILKYVSKSPEKKYGGFDDQTIHMAQSALYHLKRLRMKKRERTKKEG